MLTAVLPDKYFILSNCISNSAITYWPSNSFLERSSGMLYKMLLLLFSINYIFICYQQHICRDVTMMLFLVHFSIRNLLICFGFIRNFYQFLFYLFIVPKIGKKSWIIMHIWRTLSKFHARPYKMSMRYYITKSI